MTEEGRDLPQEAARLLAQITPGEWFAKNLPPNGWTVYWCEDGPICHMRWTDGLRPEVEARLEAEARFIAASPRLVRDLLALVVEQARQLEELQEAHRALLKAGADGAAMDRMTDERCVGFWRQSFKDLAEDRDEKKHALRKAEATVSQQAQQIAQQRAYLQHRPECAKRSRTTCDDLMVPLEPWLADSRACTCGLAAVLDPPEPT